jgi:hypothetical protein
MTFNTRGIPPAPDPGALGRSEQARGEAFTRPEGTRERAKGISVKVSLSSIMGIFRRKRRG